MPQVPVFGTWSWVPLPVRIACTKILHKRKGPVPGTGPHTRALQKRRAKISQMLAVALLSSEFTQLILLSSCTEVVPSSGSVVRC